MPRKKLDGKPTQKAEATRKRILDTALRLFLERGYEGTTMRAVASEAGVALGNAYYYFRSKEHLIQGFYARTHEEHMAALMPRLASERDLGKRIELLLVTKIETSEPYHRFSGLLFKTAADPKSPLNPFSAESSPLRAEATALFDTILEGSSTKVPADLRTKLPELLWLFEMSVILFWIHDESQGRERTRRLIARTVEIVTKLISVASFPLMKPLRKSALELIDELKMVATEPVEEEPAD
jgi:AcrR family transcriptional regulator